MIHHYPIIPRPRVLRELPGEFRFDRSTKCVVDAPELLRSPAIRAFAERLRKQAGIPFPLLQQSGDSAAELRFSLRATPSGNDESYSIRVYQRVVEVSAPSERGLHYATQTLFQLLPPAIYALTPRAGVKWLLPCVEIDDSPRFRWRGAHLDVARHFFPVSFVKRYLDLLALHKLNIFHWHLTDDQGWRIEINHWPELTQIGAWRAARSEHWNDRAPQQTDEPADYGGCYTQAEIREVVAYAAERGITVVPEIEMPGHCLAALAARPELSCTGGPFTVPTGQYWPITNLFCAGRESVFDFLTDVLGQVADLFPGPFIHIGGDEADKQQWEVCPHCQARIVNEQLRNETELQGWFMERVTQMLAAVGKRAVGWEEILHEWELPGVVVMSWKGVDAGIAAARAGYDVVMCPVTHCYFDHYQGPPEREPPAFGGDTPLEKVYAFEPVPGELDPAAAARVLGAQANLWTEYIPTAKHAEYMLLPRLAALAEVVWSPAKSRNWDDFQRRLGALRERYDALGVHHAAP